MGKLDADEKRGGNQFPSGTVTFLFTDIEGSTRLLERLLEKYALVLDGQRQILRSAFARWSGHEIDTQGDSFFAAFPRAIDAINCAIEAQHELAQAAWPDGVSVRVRMGLHTGEPIIVGEGRYVGLDVHLAARIAASGYGGQGLEFTPDGRRLVIGEPERIKVIALTLEELVRIAQERVTRPFTDAECEQYLHLEACPKTTQPAR